MSRSSFSDFKVPVSPIGNPIVTARSPARSPAELVIFTSWNENFLGSPDSLPAKVNALSGGKSCLSATPKTARSGTMAVTLKSSPALVNGSAIPPSIPIFAPATVTPSLTVHRPPIAPVR